MSRALKRPKRLVLTRAMLEEVLDIKCGRCDGPAKLHPPTKAFPNGACICPVCSFKPNSEASA